MKPSHPDSGTRLKGLVAATPVLGTAALSLSLCIPVVNFYFALLGVVLPFAHNVVEAMSAGVIPFLQEGYANLFQPALIDRLQAVTFKDINDLEAR